MRTPVRHGEGKFFVPTPKQMDDFDDKGQLVCRYVDPKDPFPSASDTPLPYPICPNASMRNVAGVCDPTGLVYGMMPHPEAYHSKWLGATWTREPISDDWVGEGMKIFQNAVDYVMKN